MVFRFGVYFALLLFKNLWNQGKEGIEQARKM
jgi:hypothetical protein